MSEHVEPAPVGEQPTPERPPVSVKGGADGLRISVARADPVRVETSLRQHLAQRAGSFFGDARVSLEMPPGRMDMALAARLAEIIEAAGMRVTTISAATAVERRAGREPSPPSSIPVEGAKVVETTLRSGQRIAHGGSVVILGDVNPGAEVLAGESVVVWGRLRGMVEAGLARDADAVGGIVVCALDLAPTQLRIGQAIARAPEEPERVPEPEVARCIDGRIVVDPWS